MYGQSGRRKEVKLVRMRQYDKGKGYVGGSDPQRNGSHRIPWKGVSILLAVCVLVAAGFFGGMHFMAAGKASQESVVVDNLQASSNVQAEAADAEAGDIVLLEEQEPRAPLVVIDPGHGGDDYGCIFAGVTEREVNLEIALLLAEKLREMDIDVVLTREDSETWPSLAERVEVAEQNHADLYISIHQNSYDDASVEGIETWYSSSNQESKRLAQLVNMGALDETGAKSRGLMVSEELLVIREASMPSCLIETGFLSNEKEREALCDPAYQEKLADGIAWGIYYYFYPKTMYLTFDDGPSEENTAAILDILKERGIHATFFVVGENVRLHPDMARRIVEEGHTIGIHCNHHDYGEIYASVDSFLDDFQAAYDTVYEVTGVEVQLFRFPGGSVNDYNKDVYEEIIAEMTERGFIYFDWNGSLDDAVKNTTPEQLIQNARQSTLNRKKVVMLAHDIVYNTALCLDDLIEQFPEYKMEPLTADVKPIQF